VFLVAGVGLLGLAAYSGCSAWWPAADPALEVPQTDIALTDVEAKQIYTFPIRFHNHSSQPLRVLGVGFC
jgi:hypothetical protein